MNIVKNFPLWLLLVFVFATSAFAQRYAVSSGNWDDPIWSNTQGGIAGSAATPTSADNIIINSGVLVTVNTASASCLSVNFQDSTGSFALASGAVLNVYGNFTVDSMGTAFSSWATGAKLRFTGSNQQMLSGFRLGSNSLDSTVLMEVVVDKSADTLKTPGVDMKIGLGTSLHIAHGVFMLGYRDDINGRIVGGSTTPTITVDTGGVFYMFGSLSAIRSGVSGSNSIGKMVVRGTAYLSTTSSIGICIDGLDVESGGVVRLESFSSTSPNNVKLDTINVKRGAQIYNGSSINFWNASTVLNLDTSAIYKVTTATTNFPPVFNNTGTVRYQRTAGDSSQTIVDMNYYRLEISFGGSKTWTLGGDRYIFDSLETNNQARFYVTAASPYNLTINGTMRLTSGYFNNSDPDVTVTMSDGSAISRATGVLLTAPNFEASVNLRYTSTVTSVATGPEVPASAGVLQDVSLLCDTTTVTLSTPMTINGTLTLSNGFLNNSSQTLTFANGAIIRRATGSLTAVPVWAGTVNLEYISTVSSVATGFELPTATNVLQALSIESPRNITLSADATVNGSFTMTRGILYLGNNSLTIASGATISNPTDTCFIATNGTGTYKQMVASLPATLVFAIGDTSNGAKHYTPAVLTIASGTANPGAYVTATTTPSKYPQNLASSDYLNRYWTIAQSGLSSFTSTATFRYAESDVNGFEGNLYLAKWEGGVSSLYSAANGATNELSGTGITSFANFTGQPIATTVNYNFISGWNLVSVPVSKADMSKGALFPAAVSQAFAYQTGYVSRDTMTRGVGYWLKFNSALDYSLDGMQPSAETIAVNQGWNIIGSLSRNIHKSQITPVGTTIASNLFLYNGAYNTTDTVFAGRGFWVKVGATGQLILSASSLAKQENESRFDESKYAKLRFTDARGLEQVLYVSNSSVQQGNLDMYEMPPALSFAEGSAGFDVRFASNRFVEQTGGKELAIRISSDSYPVTVTFDNMSSGGAVVKTGATSTSVENGSKIVLQANTKQIGLTLPSASNSNDVPVEFSMKQNYPNPFNPSTAIEYSLPEESKVVVEVFTLLGQKVQTLVQARQSEGVHTAQWSPVNMPSGMYMYKLTAVGEKTGKQFTQVSKMVFMK